jgi:DNA topoisomerase-1
MMQSVGRVLERWEIGFFFAPLVTKINRSLYMSANLVIVESPAKAKTIEGYLGPDFKVLSSLGHIRDLPKGNTAIDIDNGFEPKYELTADKKNFAALKKYAKAADLVWLATDEDREGEAISWHLQQALNLDENKTRRIVFHEITKPAILAAVKKPRKVNMPLVDAQQARRVLDRLVGFELSPVLWKKIKPGLSAGRVQSVAVRIIVEREREIMAHQASSHFRVTAKLAAHGVGFKAELNKKPSELDGGRAILAAAHGANLKVDSLTRKPIQRKPKAPFTTSTLQQEASRKLGFGVQRTMGVAQKLYESGQITYMRTDSTNLSDLALDAAADFIGQTYGSDYATRRKFSSKSPGAQEAHEACRPTDMSVPDGKGDRDAQKLYDLIFKRTLASQMADATIEKTAVEIGLPGREEKLVARGEVIKFAGFIKVYQEGTDDEDKEQDGQLPAMEEGDALDLLSLLATQRFTKAKARFTEASLVKEMEELGIGRPSTYASTIDTVQRRNYVVKEDRDGKERKYEVLELMADGQIEQREEVEMAGSERNKMFPTDIGMVVTDFLVEHFSQVIDKQFTARVEEEFDEIALGNKAWQDMIKAFYKPFHDQVELTTENAERASGERILGVHPESGKTILVRIGRFGPIAQIGAPEDEEKTFASLLKGQNIETLTLEDALELFKLPRDLGLFQEKKVVAAIGRFGPYIRHDGKFVSIHKDSDDSPYTIELDRAVELIEEKIAKDAAALIRVFEESEDVRIIEGRWGPYIKNGKDNVKIPKEEKEIPKMTWERAQELIEIDKTRPKRGRKGADKKTAVKKTAVKKTAKKAKPKAKPKA